MVHLSLIIPAYNEEQRIAVTLDRIHDFLSSKKYDFEIILIDDGSRDGTVNVAAASKLAKENKLTILSNGLNKGKGFSVKTGIVNSGGEYILFSDADLSTPIEELDKLLGFIKNGYDIAIGSRALKDSEVKVHQSLCREVMGKAFNFLIKILLMNKLHDTQCGFKLFKSSAAKAIASNMKIDGFSFDVEMLYLAVKYGYSIKEVPVVWRNSPKSKVNPLIDPAKMFFDLIKIKTMHG